jgi:hypothetical protein
MTLLTRSRHVSWLRGINMGGSIAFGRVDKTYLTSSTRFAPFPIMVLFFP